MPNKYKTTWQHPRSKHWHVLDYIITRQRDIWSARHASNVRHWMLVWPPTAAVRSVCAINTSSASSGCQTQKAGCDQTPIRWHSRAAEELPPADSSSPGANAEGTWIRTKDVTFKVASEVLGHSTTKHKDWFDDQDAEARALLDLMHSTHLAWINDKSSSTKKAAYAHARSRPQSKLRDMKDQWLGPMVFFKCLWT